jgi:Zn ribbon nucleic-acid-binding protein
MAGAACPAAEDDDALESLGAECIDHAHDEAVE